MASTRWFKGTFAHTPQRGTLAILDDCLVGVDAHGRIDSIVPASSSERARIEATAKAAGVLVSASSAQMFVPGFVDLHVHAPQWPQLGRALHLPLERWLNDCTFPLEARFADTDYARVVYESLVPHLLANGTTTAAYFGSVHLAATQVLAECCAQSGQRALVGKVVMDEPTQCPDYYRDESAVKGLEGTVALAEFIAGMPGNQHGLVQPAITPRFIPSCTDDVLTALGDLAQSSAMHVQTHCSESDWEHAYVRNRMGRSDCSALNDFGLITRRTVLAHGNFLGTDDMDLISTARAGIAHCPLSNAYFADSVFPLRAALDNALHIGLGTDISGGPSASMFDAARSAIWSSRVLEHGVDPSLSTELRGRQDSRIDFREAFWLATAGGAEVLDLPIGCFERGRRFDALLIDQNAPGSNVVQFEDDSAEDIVQKIVYAATRTNIAAVYTDGVERITNHPRNGS